MFGLLTKRLRDDEGFTLIELVVVLAILGLLIALALPSYQGARQTAARDEARVMGQEWRSLEWACVLTQGMVTGTLCNSDALVGFSESNAQNWNFADNSGAPGDANGYVIVSGSGSNSQGTFVLRCAPGKSGTLASSLAYFIYMVTSGTGVQVTSTYGVTLNAGQAYDTFVPVNNPTCR